MKSCGDCLEKLLYIYAILGLISRTTVTSLSASKDKRCKTHHLRVNPGIPFFFERVRKHRSYSRDNKRVTLYHVLTSRSFSRWDKVYTCHRTGTCTLLAYETIRSNSMPLKLCEMYDFQRVIHLLISYIYNGANWTMKLLSVEIRSPPNVDILKKKSLLQRNFPEVLFYPRSPLSIFKKMSKFWNLVTIFGITMRNAFK